jgi:Uma2 family endonuclease
MATTTNLLSWEAFEQLPDDGMHREIVEGEVITLPPPKYGHGVVAKKIRKALEAVEDKAGCDAYQEMGYKLSDNPATWLQPDVSFIRKERTLTIPEDGYLHGAPELAVEVISLSESAADVDRKVELFLEHGSLAVWVVYPRTKKVRVYLADGTAFSRGVADKLTLHELLPGWELPVSKLFAS